MKTLAINVSLRKGSLNGKLLNQALPHAKGVGLEVETLDLKDFALPAYDGDIEASTGLPSPVLQLVEKIKTATALIVATPEYNSSFPGHFKNTFDWISRARPMPWQGKRVLFLSASPGMIGGNRGLWALRVPFEACGSFVYPDMFSLSQAGDAFDSSGAFKEAKHGERLAQLVAAFGRFVAEARR
ncbi:MAG: NADPH-dependent FMN reductase [Bacteriovoracia bacterium]